MLIFGTSCHGQNQKMPSPETFLKSWIALPDTSIGEVVQEPGNNLMLVYQDQKDNYWFGSWGEGLYKYDGTTIMRYTTEDGLGHNRIDQILEDKTGNIYLKTGDGYASVIKLR